MDQSLKSILDSDPIRNIAILGFFSNYPVEEYFLENDSALILGKSDHLWAHIAGISEAELSPILEKYNKKTKYYFSVEDWMIPIILNYGTADWIMITNRYVLEENNFIDLPNLETVTIDKSYAPFIFENSDYKDYTSIEYIEERLERDISAGIIINDNLVAWGFTHDDGALGFLNVIKEFRNKGYGLNILLSLIQMKKKRKSPVFGNILPENTPSINLVNKLGFKLDRRVSWLKLK